MLQRCGNISRWKPSRAPASRLRVRSFQPPGAREAYPQLLLRAGRERSVLNKHAWVFSGSLAHVPPAAQSGEVVQVCDSSGHPLALGHWNKDASLACRIFHFGSHPVDLDETFWKDKLRRAAEYRTRLGLLKEGARDAGYRLCFSEADALPGLVVDVFGDVACLRLHTQGMLNLRPLIVRYLQEELGLAHVFYKGDAAHDGPDSGWLVGGKQDISFAEDGLLFPVDVAGGQKTGYFLDQRDNRRLVGSYAQGRTVLDAFSYSGGFSVFALAGGARHVTSVDASQRANELCERTVAANFGSAAAARAQAPPPHRALKADCFQYLRELESGHFDLIVLDPPAFAKTAATAGRAARGYKDINLLALRHIRPGGLLFTFSCSQHISKELFRKIVYGAAKDAGRAVRIVHQLGQAPDHPVGVFHPEGEYLKGLVLYVE